MCVYETLCAGSFAVRIPSQADPVSPSTGRIGSSQSLDQQERCEAATSNTTPAGGFSFSPPEKVFESLCCMDTAFVYQVK